VNIEGGYNYYGNGNVMTWKALFLAAGVRLVYVPGTGPLNPRKRGLLPVKAEICARSEGIKRQVC
jgi:hypothetical protein